MSNPVFRFRRVDPHDRVYELLRSKALIEDNGSSQLVALALLRNCIEFVNSNETPQERQQQKGEKKLAVDEEKAIERGHKILTSATEKSKKDVFGCVSPDLFTSSSSFGTENNDSNSNNNNNVRTRRLHAMRIRQRNNNRTGMEEYGGDVEGGGGGGGEDALDDTEGRGQDGNEDVMMFGISEKEIADSVFNEAIEFARQEILSRHDKSTASSGLLLSSASTSSSTSSSSPSPALEGLLNLL